MREHHLAETSFCATSKEIMHIMVFGKTPVGKGKIAYLLTDLFTPWTTVLLEKLTGLQLVKKFPTYHGTRKFITAFTNTRHMSLSCA